MVRNTIALRNQYRVLMLALVFFFPFSAVETMVLFIPPYYSCYLTKYLCPKCTAALPSAQRPRGGALPAHTRLPGVSARLRDDRELRHAPAHAARFVATNAGGAAWSPYPAGAPSARQATPPQRAPPRSGGGRAAARSSRLRSRRAALRAPGRELPLPPPRAGSSPARGARSVGGGEGSGGGSRGAEGRRGEERGAR